MKKHTKIYLEDMGYDPEDYIPCEIPGCGKRAVDIHHIESRGMGGTVKADNIKNLMGLCRYHHDEYGDKKQYKKFLQDIHDNNIPIKHS